MLQREGHLQQSQVQLASEDQKVLELSWCLSHTRLQAGSELEQACPELVFEQQDIDYLYLHTMFVRKPCIWGPSAYEREGVTP